MPAEPMFYMLSQFDLKPTVSLDAFNRELDRMMVDMKQRALVESADPVMRRRSDTDMDTDDARQQTYCFLMRFSNKAQCDRSYAAILAEMRGGNREHESFFSMVDNAIFTCYEDL